VARFDEISERTAGDRAWLGRKAASYVAIAVVMLVAAAACHGEAKVVSDAAPPPDLKAKLRVDSARAADVLWQQAMAGDRVELARLADREGASGLLEGLEEGGPVALAALAALPYAEDAELAYRRLGEVAASIDPDDARPVLDALLGVAARRRKQTEPLDPPGMRSSADDLLRIARGKDAPARVRALAISALRLLAERGAVDARAIPTDLDVK
jgi:hypothetical protein